ncbi:hypothetical protein ACVXG7_32015 [Enterobacter hormaechei]
MRSPVPRTAKQSRRNRYLLAGEDNQPTSADIDTLEDPRKRASLIGFSPDAPPDQEKWSGDGAGFSRPSPAAMR